MTNTVHKFCEPLLNYLYNKQLAFGNLQLENLAQGVAIGLKYTGPSARPMHKLDVSLNYTKRYSAK